MVVVLRGRKTPRPAKTRSVNIALVFAALFSACVDTSAAWDLREAAQFFDANPVPQPPDGLLAAATQTAPPKVEPLTPRAPLFAEVSAEAPTGPNTQATGPSRALLGRGAAQEYLALDQSCEALPLPADPGPPILLVLALQAARPQVEALFQARAAQQRLAACYQDLGLEVARQLRVGQTDLDQPAQILVYF